MGDGNDIPLHGLPSGTFVEQGVYRMLQSLYGSGTWVDDLQPIVRPCAESDAVLGDSCQGGSLTAQDLGNIAYEIFLGDLVDCANGEVGGCVWLAVGFATGGVGKTAKAADVTSDALQAANAADKFAEIGFRSDTSHIFRDARGHLAKDTADNRALIRTALDPANLRTTVTLRDGTTLEKYFKTLPDGTQSWAEIRNGEITNGGLNVVPR